MASVLRRARDYKDIAKQYSKFNQPQVKYGKELFVSLDVQPGATVLDMGCGTGEITSFIADSVGEQGHVLGVDPDEERIKIATSQHSAGRTNITFMVGDSSNNFTKAYYDLFYSHAVFHWLNSEEKDTLLQTAIECLKPGGRIAMQGPDKNMEMIDAVPQLLPGNEIENYTIPFQFVEKPVIETLLIKAGFEILISEFINCERLFSSVDNYLAYVCAFGCIDGAMILPEKKQTFAKKFARDDGTVCLNAPVCRTIAMKPRGEDHTI